LKATCKSWPVCTSKSCQWCRSDKAGKWRTFIGFEEGRLKGPVRDKDYGRKYLDQYKAFKQVTEGGLIRECSKRRIGPFQGLPKGIMFLLTACFHSLRLQMRGFHDLLRKKPASLLMLLG
jgi:hypothetical protein